MSKFKVGDRILVNGKGKGKQCALGSSGSSNSDDWIEFEATVTGITAGTYISFEALTGKKGDTCYHYEDDVELIKGEQTMGRRTFRLLKESEYYLKGAIFQENCEDGTQDFSLVDESDSKFAYEKSGSKPNCMPRTAILEQPKWFEEVFNPADQWFTKTELEAFKTYLKKVKK